MNFEEELDVLRDDHIVHQTDCTLESHALANSEPPTEQEAREEFDQIIAEVIRRAQAETRGGPPTTFSLIRVEDETGVSGTGKVAEGAIYSDDHVSMRWIVGEYRSTVAYDSIEAVEAIHGHGGKTRIVKHGAIPS